MEKEIAQFILNTLGIVIIWHYVLKNKDFDLYSKKGLYAFVVIALSVCLIKIRLT